MKQALEETADGTPDAAPAVIKPTKARRRNDEIAVEFALGIEHDKGKPKVETRREQELWRHAEELAGPSPSPLASSLALTVALVRGRCPVAADGQHAIGGARQPG